MWLPAVSLVLFTTLFLGCVDQRLSELAQHSLIIEGTVLDVGKPRRVYSHAEATLKVKYRVNQVISGDYQLPTIKVTVYPREGRRAPRPDPFKLGVRQILPIRRTEILTQPRPTMLYELSEDEFVVSSPARIERLRALLRERQELK